MRTVPCEEANAGTKACCVRCASTQALQVILTMTLRREAAAACLGVGEEEAITFWPSSLYALLASTAVRSDTVWRRCGSLLDASFGTLLARAEREPPAAIAELFLDGRNVLSGHELAALLWALVRRQEPVRVLMASQLAAELEVAALLRFGEAGGPQPSAHPLRMPPAARRDEDAASREVSA